MYPLLAPPRSCNRPTGAELGATRRCAPYQMPSEESHVCQISSIGVFGPFLGLGMSCFGLVLCKKKKTCPKSANFHKTKTLLSNKNSHEVRLL